MDRTWRLTDGKRWRTFMLLLRLDDLMTSYTNARPGAGPSMASFLKRTANSAPRRGRLAPNMVRFSK
jgi:hypothetical protein